MQHDTALLHEAAPVSLKGGLFTLTTLQITSRDFACLNEFLEQKIAQAPNFFQNAPIVLDLSHLTDTSWDIRPIIHTLRQKGFVPVGVKGGSIAQRKIALELNIATLGENKFPKTQDSEQAKNKNKEKAYKSSMVITKPVRSGQQIYAKEQDLIICGTVGHGAEVLADGHIHIYGHLRGRALAGIQGDTSARIFCQSIEAELISIAGQFMLSEDIEQIRWLESAEVRYEENGLKIYPL